jgi:hypothetical protein
MKSINECKFSWMLENFLQDFQFVSWLAKLYGKQRNNPIPFKDLQHQSIHIVM